MSKVNKRKNHRWMIAFAMLAVLIGLCSMAYAKYIQQDQLKDTLMITADIGTIELLEHQAERNLDGSYSLNDVLLPILDDPDTTGVDEAVLGNTYEILPGLDIPKDPFVKIEKTDNISVYVYVKIHDSIDNDLIEYSINNQWKYIAEDSGDKVYVYTNGTDEAFAVTESIDKIEILENNKVVINQEVRYGTKTDNLGLIFYAYMYQTASGTDALSVYNNTHS